MIKGLLGAALIAAKTIYLLFANPECETWSSVSFITDDAIVLLLAVLLTGVYRDRLVNVFVNTVLIIFSIVLVFDIVSLFDVNVFNSVNRSYAVGGVVVFILLIYLVYANGRLVKR